jgi:hypothetical protein
MQRGEGKKSEGKRRGERGGGGGGEGPRVCFVDFEYEIFLFCSSEQQETLG